jgi:hypothetical protein
MWGICGSGREAALLTEANVRPPKTEFCPSRSGQGNSSSRLPPDFSLGCLLPLEMDGAGREENSGSKHNALLHCLSLFISQRLQVGSSSVCALASFLFWAHEHLTWICVLPHIAVHCMGSQ